VGCQVEPTLYTEIDRTPEGLGCTPRGCHRNANIISVNALCNTGSSMCIRFMGTEEKPGYVQDSSGERCFSGVTWGP